MTFVALKEFCKTSSGGTPSRDRSEFYTNGHIPWVKSGELRETIITNTSEKITNLALEQSSAKLVPAGSILLAMYGATVGRMALLGIEASTNQAVCSIQPDPMKADTKYIYHALLAKIPEFLNKAVGGAQPNISQAVIKDTKIHLPSLTEQKRIAYILEKAHSICCKRREALTLADDFLRAVFLEMFGDPVLNDMDWPVAALDTVADVRSGATKGRKLQDKPTTTLPYMRVANVQDGRLSLDDIQEIEVLTSEVNKYSLQAGDLLLTEGGDPDKLGRGAVWNAELLQCLHQNHIFAVRVNTVRILPEFLSAQISSLRGKRYFLKVGKQTTGIATINKTVLSQYPTLVPPLAAQQKYVEVTAKIRSYKESLQIALQASEEFFSANSAKLLSA